jgi:hypothetical protein
MSLWAIFTATGLAGAAGHRAFLPALGLGALHRLSAALATSAGGEPLFALSDGYLWLADPAVMAVLGLLVLVELVAEANEDLPELVEWSQKLPKAVAGFLMASAAVGTVHDDVGALLASGILGAGVSMGVDTLRIGVKRTAFEPLGATLGPWGTRGYSLAESGWSLGVVLASVLLPVLGVAAVVAVAATWFATRRMEARRRVPCPRCGEKIHRRARVCAHCRAEVGELKPPPPGDSIPAT